MPTYVYRCTKCGEESEVVQSMSDPPLKRCKKCGGALRRIFQPAGIVLKGSGFHRTDYRTKPAKSDGDKQDAPSGAPSKDAASGAPSKDAPSSAPSKDAPAKESSDKPAKAGKKGDSKPSGSSASSGD